LLPQVVELAEQNMLAINPNTRDKKEVMAKCPFCAGESKNDKFYLSLNPHKNVFKCWYCKKFGGAIQFEALLENEEYQTIYRKYFGKGKKKTKHPALKLEPNQLRAIGWQQVKVQDYETFKKKQNEVLRHWKIYEYEEMTKLYAVYLLVGYFDHGDPMRYQQWFIQKTNETVVSDVIKKIKSSESTKWKEKGTEIARKVYKVTRTDDSPENLFVNVLILIELMRKNGSKSATV